MNVRLINERNEDLMTVNAARVSYNKRKEELDEKDEKLLNYLIKHKHSSPFYHSEVVKALHTSYMTMYRHMRDPWIEAVQPDPKTNDFLVKTSRWGWYTVIKRLEKLNPTPQDLISTIQNEDNNVCIDDGHPHANLLASISLLMEDVPIPIREQLLKHRMGLGAYFYEEYELARNEISRRYTSEGVTFFEPDVWYAGENDNNKQAEAGEHTHPRLMAGLYREAISKGKNKYDVLINAGLTKQQARFVLPQAMNSSWYWTGSPDAFARIVALRLHNTTGKAQNEASQLAQQINDVIEPAYPQTWKQCLEGYGV